MAKKLYVGNLSYGTTDSDLQGMFEEFGSVQSAQVIMDRESGRSKGFGFVEMGSDQEAQAAINALNGKDVDGRALTVNEAKPREDRGGRSGGGGRGGYGGEGLRRRQPLLEDTVCMTSVALPKGNVPGKGDFLFSLRHAAVTWQGNRGRSGQVRRGRASSSRETTIWSAAGCCRMISPVSDTFK